jgi:hypothetical protein
MTVPSIVGTPAKVAGRLDLPTTLTYNHTSGHLLVFVTTGYLYTITGMEWNGTAMDLLGEFYHPSYAVSRILVYFLEDAATGTHDIVPIGAGGYERGGLTAVSVINVDTTTPIGTVAQANWLFTGTPIGALTVTASGDSNALMFAVHTFRLTNASITPTLSAGSGCTAVGGQPLIDSYSVYGIASLVETAPGGSSVAMACDSTGAFSDVDVTGLSIAFALNGSTGGGGGGGTFTVTTQPRNAVSGKPLDTFVVTSSNSSYTGNVTILLESGSGTLSGTLTVAAVAGVATFSNVIITGSGTHTLRATGA